MKLDSAVRAELERLLSACCDDEPTEAERTRLNELLRNDAGCRQFYLRYMDLHARLLQRPGASLPVGAMEPNRGPGSAVSTGGLTPPPGTILRSYLWLILASAVVVPAARWLWLQANDEGRPTPVASSAGTLRLGGGAASSAAPNYLATVLATDDVIWADRYARDPGSRLKSSVLKLESGRVALQFDGGARLTLYGPAMLKLLNKHSVMLVRGRALFRGDDSVAPFELLTPQARWVDEGAEYGTVVTPHTEELHVIAGEVLRTGRPEATPTTSPLWLAKGQARRFARDGEAAGTAIPLDSQWQAEAKVRCSSASTKASPSGGLIAYDSFEPKTLRDWRGAWALHDRDAAEGEFRRTFGLRHASMTEPGDARLLRGRVAVSRLLPAPVKTGSDGVYYFSFLVRAGRIELDDQPCDVQLSFRNSRVVEPQRKLSTSLSWSRNSIAVGWEGGGRQASVPLDAMRVYAVVGKIALGGERPDQIFVRLYGGKQSLPSSEPPDWTVASLPVTSLIDFDTVQWSSASTNGIAIDELRLGSTWNAVAGPYELPIVAAASLGKQRTPIAK